MSDFSKSRHKPQGDLHLKIRIVLYICAHRTNTPHKMKFRTEINIKPFAEKVDHQSHIFSIGSCFAQYMADELLEAKFDICSNPFGVMFNPASIHAALLRLTKCELFSHEDIVFDRDRWFSYDLHSSFDEISSQCILTQANASVAEGNMRLENADWVVITFGTAWVYTLNESGKVVANCHKQPASNFTRHRLSVTEIVEMYDELMRGVLADKQVIFTVSPVRHLSDGADENFLSKAILKVAVAEIVERFDNAHYFPAYEILNDDLRDYRFYADDLCHPSTSAREYIREKFFGAILSPKSLQLLPRIKKIVRARAHLPFEPMGKNFKEFCRQQIQEIDSLPEIDFSDEREYFATFIE